MIRAVAYAARLYTATPDHLQPEHRPGGMRGMDGREPRIGERMTRMADDAMVQGDQVLDLRGLRCPMPLLKTKQALGPLAVGARLLVITSDPGSKRDIPAYLDLGGHRLESCDESPGEGTFHFLIVKGARANLC